ncbi:response regulator [Geobacter sp. FeAm09]|uniref:hybrid sensor histidine kinase/response regulator n=1 Tax=Geobacter sp. FeAm09 TaxID=2597769 RepID=UPI0011ECD337|nr:hybrid sensor histidine kinase/response regulator [Geobacter sp. FeAm09]QEM67541.1 response regulator [Geobacter sp. FeAm09]
MPEAAPPISSPVVAARASLPWLAASVLLINLFVAGLAAYSLQLSRRQYESRVAIQTQNLAQSLNLTIAGLIDKAALTAFAAKKEAERQLAGGGLDAPAMRAYLRTQQERVPELEDLRIANARGEIVYGRLLSPGVTPSIGDRNSFIAARMNPWIGLMVTKPYLSRVTGKWAFSIAWRIDDPKGGFAGIVYGVVSLEYLTRLFASLDLGTHGLIALRDADLALVVRYPELPGVKSSTGSTVVSREFRGLVRNGQASGTYRTAGSLDPVARTFSFRKIANYPLYVTAGLAVDDYLTPWRGEAAITWAMVAFFALGSLATARLLYRNRRLEEQAEAELLRHRGRLEEMVRERTSLLEARNVRLAEEIDRRRQVEADWQKSAIVMDRMSDAVTWIGPDGRFLYVNDAACRMSGCERQDLLARQVWDVSSHYTLETWQLHWERLRREGFISFETVTQTRDGRRFPIEISANYLNIDGQEYDCAIVRDISERREAEDERQALMIQLSQSQKIESIGRLAGGLSHDFNNLLTPILGYAELLKNRLPADSRDGERVDRIMEAADKARVLTQQLLSFSRKQFLEMRPVDLNNVIGSFYEILRRTIRENIAIRLRLSEIVYAIRADRNQLEQIIMNLAINAQDAIADRGAITIETAPVTLDDEYVRQHAGLAPGRYLMLGVSDTGAGMDRETLSHIFEPFFTTKDVGKGSGLGLATVYGLVRQHGGHIVVFSEEGEGTTFKIFFPLEDDAVPVETASVAELAEVNVAGSTILLVEDNDMVRNLVRDLLDSCNCRLIVAEGPLQALALSAGREVDLLLTDVVMPDMNGPELHDKLRSSHPGLKAIYMSGYTDNAFAAAGASDAGADFIQKPFTTRELLGRIDAILNGADGAGEGR